MEKRGIGAEYGTVQSARWYARLVNRIIKREGVMPDDRRALLYGPVESLGDAIRLDDLETATRYRHQLNVFFVAPYATTGEPLGDAIAELYKVSGWWLRKFHDRAGPQAAGPPISRADHRYARLLKAKISASASGHNVVLVGPPTDMRKQKGRAVPQHQFRVLPQKALRIGNRRRKIAQSTVY